MAKSKENKNKPKLNLTVREEQDGVGLARGLVEGLRRKLLRKFVF